MGELFIFGRLTNGGTLNRNNQYRYVLPKTFTINLAMKNLFTFLSLFLIIGTLFAQPINDDCMGLIDLGIAPVCNLNEIYDNVDATPSDIGFGNIPGNFNGGTINNDVWFSFTTPADIQNFSISVYATPDGDNTPIQNPQIALYRGSCQVNGLSELTSASAANGGTEISATVLGLTPNTTYFIRVDAYSASGTPNWGDFVVCVQEYVPDINMGDEIMTTACTGTIYDSGGADGDYQSNEDLIFTICPNEVHSCITLEVVDFEIENNFDHLNIHTGTNTNAPVITTLTGQSTGGNLNIYVTSNCVTLHFTSDGSVTRAGFQINWQCSPADCGGSSFDNPTVIDGLPFTDSASTCEGGINSTVVPCTGAFTTGASTIYQFQTDGGFCAAISTTDGTGVYVLSGHPDDPNTECLGESDNGGFGAFNFEQAGTYYIVVASPQGCGDFTLNIEEAPCALSPALDDALCNPLNGCVEMGGVPSVFVFEQGFQDMEIEPGVNSGCWLGLGAQPDFYWFTIQASNDGNFGFILEGANNVDSDIDINVWGPFSPMDVCENQTEVIDYIRNNQPIRSTYAPGDIHTGLVDIHPDFGTPVTDAFDCGDPTTPGAGGDDFISTIPVIEGEVYVVLVNDFGNAIADNGISIDWSPSTPGVLDTVGLHLNAVQDTAICAGQPLLLSIDSPIEDIVWEDPNGYLSCTECPNPIATVPETTSFQATVNAVCYSQTVDVKVNVIKANAGEDITVCLNEDIQLSAGSTYEFIDYSWDTVPGLTFSCTDCPDPIVIADSPGTYTLTVSVVTPLCSDSDEVVVTVLPQTAPDFNIPDDQSICVGETIAIGDANAASDVNFSWTSVPTGFSSAEANPSVQPVSTTTYYVSATNGVCPSPSLDSITVQVDTLPVIAVANDTTICIGEALTLGNTLAQENIQYQWEGPGDFDNPNDPNTLITPNSSGTFTLTADNGACTVSEEVVVDVVNYAIDLNTPDTLKICLGESINLQASVTPADAITQWYPDNGTLSTQSGNDVIATPTTSTTYIGTVGQEGCFKMDTLFVKVDSLPDLSLMADPDKEVYCPGETVTLKSATYETYLFPEPTHQWLSGPGFETPDSLFNMVITTQDTFNYQRITTIGACIDTAEILIPVDKIPNLQVIPSDTIVCPGAQVQLTTIYDGKGELEWMFTDGSGELDTSDLRSPIATAFSQMNITVTSDDNCPASSGAVIYPDRMDIPVTLTATPSQVLSGSTIVLTAEVTGIPDGSDVSYSWKQGDNQLGTTSVPTFTVENVQGKDIVTFTVQVTWENCPGEAEAVVEIYTIDVPNVFTPNGDSANEILKLFYPDFLDMNVESFIVYNRWGQVVFEATDNQGWDGTFKGEPAASDVYIYHIIATSNGASVERSGEVILLR